MRFTIFIILLSAGALAANKEIGAGLYVNLHSATPTTPPAGGDLAAKAAALNANAAETEAVGAQNNRNMDVMEKRLDEKEGQAKTQSEKDEIKRARENLQKLRQWNQKQHMDSAQAMRDNANKINQSIKSPSEGGGQPSSQTSGSQTAPSNGQAGNPSGSSGNPTGNGPQTGNNSGQSYSDKQPFTGETREWSLDSTTHQATPKNPAAVADAVGNPAKNMDAVSKIQGPDGQMYDVVKPQGQTAQVAGQRAKVFSSDGVGAPDVVQLPDRIGFQSSVSPDGTVNYSTFGGENAFSFKPGQMGTPAAPEGTPGTWSSPAGSGGGTTSGAAEAPAAGGGATPSTSGNATVTPTGGSTTQPTGGMEMMSTFDGEIINLNGDWSVPKIQTSPVSGRSPQPLLRDDCPSCRRNQF